MFPKLYVAGSATEGGNDHRILITAGSVDPRFDAIFAPGACECEHTP